MLDNTDNQRLHERIADAAILLPSLADSAAACRDERAGSADETPFSKSKVERILERVYDRIAHEASENVDPRLRQLLAETLAQPERVPAYPERKLQRILARVQARLESDKAPLAAAKQPARRMSALASLRFAASALLHRGPRPLTDGSTD